MTAAAEEMDEVVVVVGKLRKLLILVLLLQPLKESFENRATTNVLSGIEGSVSEFTSGQPGSQPSVRIRVLVLLVDLTHLLRCWVPYTGDINNINSADVESITILRCCIYLSLWVKSSKWCCYYNYKRNIC
jgi:hypothetical protein